MRYRDSCLHCYTKPLQQAQGHHAEVGLLSLPPGSPWYLFSLSAVSHPFYSTPWCFLL